MNVHIEELPDYGADGITVYSAIKGMDFYYVEVRASGISLYEPEGFEDGQEIDIYSNEDIIEKVKQVIRSEYEESK